MAPPRITLAEFGRPVQVRRSGNTRAVRVHIASPPGPLTRRPLGYAERDKSAGRASLHRRRDLGQLWGEHAPRRGRRETLMGPGPTYRCGPQKRLSPHAGSGPETNERAKGWKVGPRPGGSRGREPRAPGQSNDMADTSGTGLAPVGSPPRGVQPASSTAGACDRATRAPFAQANRCTQTRRTGEGDTASLAQPQTAGWVGL
jgi:hypothetical protein